MLRGGKKLLYTERKTAREVAWSMGVDREPMHAVTGDILGELPEESLIKIGGILFGAMFENLAG